MALPDLYLHTGSGWTAGVCLSVSPDVRAQEGPFSSDDCLYLSFAVANGGTGGATPFAATVCVDGRMVYALEYEQELPGRSAVFAEGVCLDALSAGIHEITIVCDVYNAVAESDESNNSFTRTVEILPGATEPGDCLLDTLWAQRGNGLSSYGYNAFVPDGLRTGCTPVALGQILRYWDALGYGISLHVDAEKDYFTMAAASASYRVAPADLEERCGISEYEIDALLTDARFDEANWDDDGTISALQLLEMLVMHSSVEDDVTGTRMGNEAFLLERAGFGCERISCQGAVPWEKIQEDVAAGMPVLAGLDGGLMHSVVIDGHAKETDRWHVNFGWGAEDARKYDEKYGMEAGTGWYTKAQMEAFGILTLLVDIHPLYEADRGAASTMDWSRKVYGALEPEAGFLVTVSRAGEWTVTADVAAAGVNVLAAQEELALSAESVTGIALERSREVAPVLAAEDAPALLEAPDNGLADLFFARTDGSWGRDYAAVHCITGEQLSMEGKNHFCDIFRTSNDVSILYLTDDASGDAFFADDIYTDSFRGIGAESARLSGIREIRANAGDDLVDLTSLRFDCGDGVIVRGGSGDDVLWGGGDGCSLFGDVGFDRLAGTGGDDILVGGAGDDQIQCLGGDDILCFGRGWGNDKVFQIAGGRVTLWFAADVQGEWDEEAMVFRTDGGGVAVSGGIGSDGVSLRFGDDGSSLYAELRNMGAFLA
ncbi:MAG: C10 family peptidase [Lentisphaeria bacterium]|nr:C10 family peptidase [Lentisphaeria bacterium]